MDRRQFLKVTGIGAASLGAAACKSTVSGKDESQIGGGEMEMRLNPNTGDKVSILGYGCMRWQTKNNAEGKKIIDQDSVNELVDYAIAHGVNYFDSAPVYLQGQSELATATALLRHPRESYFIATKLSNFRNSTYEASVAMYKQSLAYYQTDHIDYYLLHSISDMAGFNRRFVDNGVLDFLLKEREAGHIRNLGFSYHGDSANFDSLLALHDKYHWDFVQIQMNYVDWNHAGDGDCDASYLYEQLAARDIPVVIMEPLLGGQLSNVPDHVAAKLKERSPQRSVASWAFRFCGSYPRVLTVLSGMTYMEHLQDNLTTYSPLAPLSEDDKQFLEEMAVTIRNLPLVPCTGCNYCMPCPFGIDIPGIFKNYNSSINAGIAPESAEQEEFKRLRRKYLAAYDKSVESIRQADHCINCCKCVPLCPQHIRIPREMNRIDAYVENIKKGTL